MVMSFIEKKILHFEIGKNCIYFTIYLLTAKYLILIAQQHTNKMVKTSKIHIFVLIKLFILIILLIRDMLNNTVTILLKNLDF